MALANAIYDIIVRAIGNGDSDDRVARSVLESVFEITPDKERIDPLVIIVSVLRKALHSVGLMKNARQRQESLLKIREITTAQLDGYALSLYAGKPPAIKKVVIRNSSSRESQPGSSAGGIRPVLVKRSGRLRTE